MKTICKTSVAGLLAFALAIFSPSASADDASAQGTSFQGKVSAVDHETRVVTIDNQTYQVLPTTRIMINNQPGEFSDIKVGEQLSGVYKKSAENKMEVLSLDIGQAVGGTADTSESSQSADTSTSAASESFSGKVTKVDPTTKTVMIGQRSYYVLPTSRITVNDQPATFSQIQVGKQISGNYKKSAENHMEVLSLDIRPAVGGTKDATSSTSGAGAAFSGKITKVDTTAQTFTIGRRTFQLLPTTQVTAQTGDTASPSNLKAGQQVSGTYKTSTEGKLEVLSLQIGNNPKTRR